MTSCKLCRGFGLIRVQYRSGDPTDLAVCSCRAGRRWPRMSTVRAWAAREGFTVNQVGRLEDFFTPAELMEAAQ